VHEKFVSSGVVQREWSISQLKDCFRNMTKKVKMNAGEKRKYSKATGGGPPVIDLSANDQKLVSILGDELKSLDNPFDSDANYHNSCEVIDCKVLEVDVKPIIDTPFIKKRKVGDSDTHQKKSFREDEHDLFMKKMEAELKVSEMQQKKIDTETHLLELQIALMQKKHEVADHKIKKLTEQEYTMTTL